MRSLWNDADTGALDDLGLLVYGSRLIGAEPSLVLWGGGNTSIKSIEHDHRGREVQVLRVKGSGADLKTIRRGEFAGVRMEDIRALLVREDMQDREIVDYLSQALQEPTGVRPSIETLLHGFLPARCVVHTHADAVVALTKHERAQEIVAAVFGKTVLTLPYLRSGFRVSRAAADAVAGEPGARAAVVEHHGTITWGESVREAYEATIELVSGAEAAISERQRGRRVFGGVSVSVAPADERRAEAARLMPRLRGLLSRSGRVIVTFDDSPAVTDFVSSAHAARLSRVGPATPDHTIYTKRLPCWVSSPAGARGADLWAAVEQAVEAFIVEYTDYFERHRQEGMALTDALPRVVLVPELGMFTAGRDGRTAGIVQDIYRHTIDVIRGATAFGAYTSLSARDVFDVEFWPVEVYKLTLGPPEKELARRVALVTGGASGIGRGIARRLASEGAHVVVADVDEAGAVRTAEDIASVVGAHRALGVRMDVTSEASVRSSFEAALITYGGLDILVSNAGAAHSTPVIDLRLDDWNRSFAVNATGHFLVAREAMRIMREQALGGALVFVATKNVMSPGKDFAAYSASKAAEAQLAKVLALEGAPLGIRSNIINPDAVFQDSRLWSEDVRAERARAQGIAVADLEEFYRKRNLLGVRVVPEDVAEAALFFASDRSSKTTGCTLTVDGGVKDAFPR